MWSRLERFLVQPFHGIVNCTTYLGAGRTAPPIGNRHVVCLTHKMRKRMSIKDINEITPLHIQNYYVVYFLTKAKIFIIRIYSVIKPKGLI